FAYARTRTRGSRAGAATYPTSLCTLRGRSSAMNIVQLIMNQLTNSGMLEKLAGMIGIAPEKARSGIAAAVPALLAALTHVASTPDGARKLDAAVEQVDDDVLADP